MAAAHDEIVESSLNLVSVLRLVDGFEGEADRIDGRLRAFLADPPELRTIPRRS